MNTRHKILIVDDNVEFCDNVSRILTLKGYEASHVCDGFKALDAIANSAFDLVLMDIKMPVMNGVETFKKLKQIAPQTPVIMITAYAVEELIREALQEGAFGVFHKPLDFEELFASIENLLPNGALMLIVDDEQMIRLHLREALVKKGFRVEVAEDGKTALQKVRENNFGIILLDMKLPVMNGLETYLGIRTIRSDAVVILITGYLHEMDDYTQQTLEQGAYICLEKPLELDRLLGLLNEIVESRSEGGESDGKTISNTSC
ncbi:MAG: response regulator [bacterium]|nr:response regulator [bacterium]